MSKDVLFNDGVEVWRVRRRLARHAARTALGLVVAPVIALMLYGVGTHLFGHPGRSEALVEAILIGWLLSWLGGVPLALVGSLVASVRTRLPIETVRVTNGGLELTGKGPRRSYAAADIEGGLVIEQLDGTSEAEIALRSGEVLFVGSSQRGGAASARPAELVESLGFAGTKRRTVVPLGGTRAPLWSTLASVALGLTVATVSTCSAVGVGDAVGLSGKTLNEALAFTMGIVFVTATLLLSRLWTPRRLVCGADGVLLEGAFRKRFFPRAEIFGVTEADTRAVLLLRSGNGVKPVKLTSDSKGRQDALIGRIRAALEQDADDRSPSAALLGRGSDAIGAWRERLRKLVAPGEGYRTRTIPADVLLRTAADADAAADVRMGAAMAIALGGDDAAKKQLRITADAVASEKLRVAIEAAADGNADEEAIAAACEEAAAWAPARR